MLNHQQKEEVISKKRKLTKKEVLPAMKKLVIKPKDINIDFSEWWDTLSDDQTVSLREDKYYRNYYFKNLKDSETLINELEYEIELEFIGNKKSKQLNDMKMEEKENRNEITKSKYYDYITIFTTK